ncbi:MAG: hypothetical protein L6Q71_09810 [Planctomycetes bacterium]|nr:hypothetical protein [Planctomycetota bacterium]NUQ34751.1 hypothetical protein [Planctomycetaceae bacterium]
MDLTPKTPQELGLDPAVIDETRDFLQPFEKLIPITVVDEVMYVPENNSLWRGLQFCGVVKNKIAIDFSYFCIAGTCKHCRALVQLPGMAQREPMLMCQTIAQPGTLIRKLPQGFRKK